ncbi:hypothetical protein [Metabacillus fastidiosus]|uniref:hypothetical protein n=1 Tax=Metabacillus fastidiosus TaxID=1458 RepID=UPI003D2C2B49
MLKKGDKVVMHTCVEAEHYNGRIWTCRTDEFKHHPNHEYTVIMLEGFSGSFQTEYLQKVDLTEYEQEIERLNETVRIYKVSDEFVKEQSKKVKHLFPLENTVGYGQLCDKVLDLSEEKSFFVKAYTEKIMTEN